MNIPEGLKYTEDHEWARVDGDGTVTIGISWHAQDLLGDIVYVELPLEGDSIDAEDEFGVVESVKAASDLYAPISGDVVEVNDALENSPELVNESPYEEGWMVRVAPADGDELQDLMNADEYEAFLTKEG